MKKSEKSECQIKKSENSEQLDCIGWTNDPSPYPTEIVIILVVIICICLLSSFNVQCLSNITMASIP